MNSAPEDTIVVFMTAADTDEAWRLAEMLVEKRLAACVQILPEMQSVFRWQGKIEKQREALLIAKTAQATFTNLEKEVRAIHSYETPEIVGFPLSAGSSAYLEWVKANVGDETEAAGS